MLLSSHIFFSSKKKKNDEKDEKDQKDEKENKIESKNTISASYIIKEGKEMSLINPDEIGLQKEDYSIEEIEIISEDKNNLRYLNFLPCKFLFEIQ